MPPPAEYDASRDWLEPDYFRRPRPLRRLRRVAGWAAAVAALVTVGATLWPGSPTVYQAGRLSSAHAMFHDQCHVCHTESFRTAHRLWPAHADAAAVPDSACLRCHDGPLHNGQQVRVPGCASCHREHQGKTRLAQVSDGHCTACHADLQRKDGQPPTIATDIRDFGAHHPEFALGRSPTPANPIRLHFDHEAHLKPGGVPGADGRPVTLRCESCHQADAGGRYMKPATYEQHCASCHPLSVQLAGRWTDPAALAAADRFRARPAPHQKPEDVRAVLRDRLLTLAAKEPALLATAAEPPDRLLPGQPAPAETKSDAAAWAQQQLQVAERMLYQGAGGCAYCHVRTEKDGRPVRHDGLPVYDPTRIPARWLTHGAFNHRSHRMLGCAECHPAAESRRSSDVLIPKIDSCRQCHNPQVGAPSGCADCHKYHDHGREAGWNGQFTIREALGPQRSGP